MTLDLDVDFENHRLHGRASLTLDYQSPTDVLWLDAWGLDVREVRLEPGNAVANFELTEERPFLGGGLRIDLQPGTERVHIDYATSPDSIAVQWLEPAQTAGGEHPFLLTQSQTVFARTWIPCQDSPGIRMTYDATIRVPPGLMAVMSAENPTRPSRDGVYRFRMPQPIPAYLLALAVGEFGFRPLGPRTGVYAESTVLDRAAWEFAETEKMMEAAEALYGPYRWDRFDMIVLPPSFPFGGMENPRLTFITPTLIAGDRSLTATVAHELAHSWSGNLVTNATWSDFWLNEGFTTYFEKRIMEQLHGRDAVEMMWILDQQSLVLDMEEMPAEATHLVRDLDGADPEEGGSTVAYEKGALFLRWLEERFGRARWDAFLAGYFERFAFSSMTTGGFLSHLDQQLVAVDDDSDQLRHAIDRWVNGPGLPDDRPSIRSDALDDVERQLEGWIAGGAAIELQTEGWQTPHRLYFVRNLPDEGLSLDRLRELDAVLTLTESGNAEVLHAWLMQTLGTGYEPAFPAAERFLTRMGRLKFLRPLYEKLAETAEGRASAERIYRRARPGYHGIARAVLDRLLGEPEA